MTRPVLSARRTSYPALMLFGIIYLSALAVVVSPDAVLRATHAGDALDDGLPMTSTDGQPALLTEARLTSKGDADVLLP